MSAALNPFGLRPVMDQSAYVRQTRYQNGVASGYNTNIYFGTPVVLVTSTYNTWQVASAGANDFGGVFGGVEYTDANGRRQFSKYWPANLAPLAGTTWFVWVWDDPRTIFEIQANGSIGEAAGRGMQGQQIDLINPGNGSTVTQLSSAAADSANISSSAQKQLRIVDKMPYVDNDWGDSFTVLKVQIARHQFIANKVAV